MDQASKLRAMVAGTNSGARESSPPKVRFDGRTSVFAVTSGKGGVGKTTIAVNLAILLAEQGVKTLLVDADLGLANVDVMLGIDAPRHFGHLLRGGMTPADIECEGPSGLRVISGGSGLRELANLSEDERESILEKLHAHYREYQCVIIDTSPGIGRGVTDFLREAREILLVTTTEPTSLRDSYAAFKTIAARLPDHKVRLVVNQSSPEHAAQAVSALNEVAMKFLEVSVDSWHAVLPDAVVGRSVRDRKPFVSGYPRSDAASSLRSLAKILVRPDDSRVGA